MGRILYRFVKTNPPTRDDFLSHQALGKPLSSEDVRDLWSGVSCQATEQQARQRAKIPGLGTFIAKLEIADESEIKCRRTGKQPGHHTVWGDPDELLALVVDTVPV